MITDESSELYSNSPLQCVQIEGQDSLTFLQGQLTNDLSLIDASPNSWQWSALCNPKGRAIATFIICKYNDGYWILCLSDIAEQIAIHLQKYILRSKVRISLPSLIFLVNKEMPSSDSSSELKSINIATEHRIIIAQNESDIKAEPLTREAFLKIAVEKKLPFIGKELTETLIPNHFDFEKYDGISYKKGCFTGQEVIARLRYLSQPQYSLFGITSSSPLESGGTLYEPQNFRDQAIGNIIAGYERENEMNIGFACIKIQATNNSRYLSLSKENDASVLITTN